MRLSRRLLLSLASALFLLAVHARAEDDPRAAARKDLERLQGVWTLVAMETEGHTLTPEQIEGRNARYTGDLISLRVGDEVRRQGIVTLLPGRSPKAINTWDLDGPFEDQTVPGIYELSPDGKTLKLCFTRPGEDRPKKFSTKAGTGFLFVVYQKKVEPK